jgi:hypothetical protein
MSQCFLRNTWPRARDELRCGWAQACRWRQVGRAKERGAWNFLSHILCPGCLFTVHALCPSGCKKHVSCLVRQVGTSLCGAHGEASTVLTFDNGPWDADAEPLVHKHPFLFPHSIPLGQLVKLVVISSHLGGGDQASCAMLLC